MSKTKTKTKYKKKNNIGRLPRGADHGHHHPSSSSPNKTEQNKTKYKRRNNIGRLPRGADHGHHHPSSSSPNKTEQNRTKQKKHHAPTSTDSPFVLGGSLLFSHEVSRFLFVSNCFDLFSHVMLTCPGFYVFRFISICFYLFREPKNRFAICFHM